MKFKTLINLFVVSLGYADLNEVKKKEKIRNRCDQISHLTQDTTIWENNYIYKYNYK